MANRVFRVVLVKPSHYDDDGYVIQWVRSSIPTNSLACVYALALLALQLRHGGSHGWGNLFARRVSADVRSGS